MSEPKEIDIRTEMQVSLFWRGLIGDSGYVKFDPDDMLRWYFALELRGPDEIRALMTERYRSRPMPTMLGVVSKAPHPPLWLVNTWLEHHEGKQHTLGIWAMAGAFVLLVAMGIPALHGCADLTPLNPLVMNPPPDTPNVAAYTAGPSTYALPPSTAGLAASMPGSGASIPGATGSTLPAAPASTRTGPVSGGIAGAAMGAVSPTGSTGQPNTGLTSTTPTTSH